MAKDYVLNDSVAWRRKCALETMTPLEYSRAKHLAFQRAHEEAAAEDWEQEQELRRIEVTMRESLAVVGEVRRDFDELVTEVRTRKVAP
jgi:hypothetical protein